MQDRRELYGAAEVRELDRRAIEDHGIPGYVLMQRAAAAAWRVMRQRWPRACHVVVIAGSGNNGGDGYEIARLAQAGGCKVQVWALGSAVRGDAATARSAWQDADGAVRDWHDDAISNLHEADVIVDAIYGTGLSRAPEAAGRHAIEAINAARARGAGVLAVDLPSGLLADTGAAPGVVVQADLTVTFIGSKLGLYTGRGQDCAGRIVFDDLDVPPVVYQNLPAQARRLEAAELQRALPPRPRTAHKGSHGHVLVVGGDHGMMGAVLLAARAALRAGAGLVSVATRVQHAIAITAAQAEVMAHGVESSEDLQPLLSRADVVAIGPGLGQDEWGRALWSALREYPRRVVDADALNLLAQSQSTPPGRSDGWILTPHPGEAARLLGRGTREVQADRPRALRDLQARYGGVPLLKGAGTLVWQDSAMAVCPYGNPGMGCGGMGDVLTGVIAALWAQGLSATDAAAMGVLAHARAGDLAAEQGERGLLPSDLLSALRDVVNP